MFIHSLKAYIKKRLLIIVVIVFSLSFFSYFVTQTVNKKKLSKNKDEVSLILPVHLSIPAININAIVQHVGVTADGEMEVPNNAFETGWFKLGPRPGEKGSSVIAGHFDNKDGGVGIFTNLYKLKKGDRLFVTDNKGKVTNFIVRESRTYDPGYTDDVFNSSEGYHLNLITCDGVWDGIKKSYSKRLVIFSDMMYIK